MGAVPPNGFGIARLRWAVAGRPDPVIVTLGIASPLGNDAADDATAVFNAFAGADLPIASTTMNSGWTFQGVEVTNMVGGEPVLGAHLQTVSGTAIGASPPPNCAILIRKHTSRGGRKGRGRIYWPPCSVDEAQVEASGMLVTNFVTDQQEKFMDALASMLNAGVVPHLLHDDGSAPNPITSFQVQPLIATQRRRLR